MPKQELTEIFGSKKKAFCMKATISKSIKRIKYALSDFHVKANKGFYPVIINSKLVERLEFKIKLISTLANHIFSMSVVNGAFT